MAYFGKVCEKHPLLRGKRHNANRVCIGCQETRRKETVPLDLLEGRLEAAKARVLQLEEQIRAVKARKDKTSDAHWNEFYERE